jgi:hypothetical protein
LAFLEERNLLDRFKRKERWRLMRQYIWPGAPEGFRQSLESVADTNAHAQAVLKDLGERKREITGAIERYNLAVRRLMEQDRGQPAAQFDDGDRAELSRRQITFAGAREELLRKSRDLQPDSPPEHVGEILSLRIGILPAEARDSLFQDVARTGAEERARERGGLDEREMALEAVFIEWHLRTRDRYYIARVLAGTYEEARHLLHIDDMLERIDGAIAAGKEDPDKARFFDGEADILRGCARLAVGYLEELWPSSRGSHSKLLARLHGV